MPRNRGMKIMMSENGVIIEVDENGQRIFISPYASENYSSENFKALLDMCKFIDLYIQELENLNLRAAYDLCGGEEFQLCMKLGIDSMAGLRQVTNSLIEVRLRAIDEFYDLSLYFN